MGIMNKAFEDFQEEVGDEAQTEAELNEAESEYEKSAAEIAVSDSSAQVQDFTPVISEGTELMGVQMQTAIAYENLCLQVGRDSKARKITPESLRYLYLAAETMKERAGVLQDKPVFALENINDVNESARLAAEGFADAAKGVWETVKKKLASVVQAVAAKMGHIKSNINIFHSRVASLEKFASGIDSKATPKLEALKPKLWFKNLYYLDSGFDVGLKNVNKDIQALLKGHVQTVSRFIEGTISWMDKNYEKVLSSEAALSQFKFTPSDLLFLNSKPFHGNVGEIDLHSHGDRFGGSFGSTGHIREAKKGMSFYRSSELPGGKGLFTYTAADARFGTDAINVLANSEYFINKYDEAQYDLQQVEIDKQIRGTWKMWAVAAGFIIGSGPGGAIVGGMLSANYNKNKYYRENTIKQGRDVHIDKNMLSLTLSPNDIKRVIGECKQTIAALEQWREKWIGDIIKDTRMDRLLKKQYEKQIDHKSSGGEKAVRNFIYSLAGVEFELISSTGDYAMSVLRSVLNYTELSAKQYV